MRALLAILLVSCAAAPVAVAPKPTPRAIADEVDASIDVVEASAPPLGINCDPPRVRDTVTLACTDHAPCANGEDLVSGACVPSCGAPFTSRDAKGGCTCAPGLVDVRGAEFGGCVKPGELDFSSMCKRPHQHFDGSVAPVCKCDAGYVEHRSGIGTTDACIKPCKAPLAYDAASDRCRACPEDTVTGVCVAKCPPNSKRDASGECMCAGTMFLDHGKCVQCMPDRVWDAKTTACNCPAGSEDWGYEGCFPSCPAGQHHLHQQCVADCASPTVNDEKTGACGPCDAAQNAFTFDVHGHAVCVRCSFDEVLDKDGACTCRPGFRRANGHCVNP